MDDGGDSDGGIQPDAEAEDGGNAEDGGDPTPELESIAVSPEAPVVGVGATQQLTATGTYSDGSTGDLTEDVTWSSEDDSVVAVDGAGLLTAVAPGTATIAATLGAVEAQVVVAVDVSLQSVEIAPADNRLAAGTQGALTATGMYSDGSTQDLTNMVEWSSSEDAVATVSNAEGEQGTVSAVAAGEVATTGTLDGVSGTARVVVTNAALESILVEPGDPTIAAGTTQAFTATGRFSDGSVQDLTTQAAWESDAAAVATIDADGLASAVAAGAAAITASFDGVDGQTTLTVSDATLQSIEVTPVEPVSRPGRRSSSRRRAPSATITPRT